MLSGVTKWLAMSSKGVGIMYWSHRNGRAGSHTDSSHAIPRHSSVRESTGVQALSAAVAIANTMKKRQGNWRRWSKGSDAHTGPEAGLIMKMEPTASSH